jgi:hypothetical protein
LVVWRVVAAGGPHLSAIRSVAASAGHLMTTSKHPPTSPETSARRDGKTGRQTYNMVTDLGAGPNVRLKDNLYQAVAILACLVLGSGVGVLAAHDKLAGLIVGGIGGLLVGLFGSGIFLMVYRSIMHARGKHD